MKFTRLTNINGYLVSNLNFREGTEAKQKKIIATGLLCPKNKISRNGVLYDWDSIKDTYDQIEGLKLMYNHETDGLDAIPIGHATKAWLKEEDDDEGIAGLYYEADLDPEHPHTRKILRGDLDNVSLQINAEEVIPKYDEVYGEYQVAKISDWIEFSVVPTPGLKDATIEARIAEAYRNLNKNETMNTTNNTGAYAPEIMNKDKKDKDEKKEDNNIKDNNTEEEDKDMSNDKKTVHLEEVQRLKEYEDDMTNITEILESMNVRLETLEGELATIRGSIPQAESKDNEVDTEADELTEETSDKDDKPKIDSGVVSDEITVKEKEDNENKDDKDTETKTEEDKTDDEDKDTKKEEDDEEDDKKKDDLEEPIPPITENVKSDKINRKLNKRESIRIRTPTKKMSYEQAIKGFVRDELKLI